MPRMMRWAPGVGSMLDPWLSVGVPSEDPGPIALGMMGKALTHGGEPGLSPGWSLQ